MEKDTEKTLDEIYNFNQQCPVCYDDAFMELKKYPGYGRCMECSYDTEVELIDKF